MLGQGMAGACTWQTGAKPREWLGLNHPGSREDWLSLWPVSLSLALLPKHGFSGQREGVCGEPRTLGGPADTKLACGLGCGVANGWGWC